MANYIKQIKDINNNTYHIKDYFSNIITTCDTAADTAAKAVTITDCTLFSGLSLKIKFTYANTATNPTFSVNNSTAARIYAYGTTEPQEWWHANEIVILTYDGTYWYMKDGASSSSGGGTAQIEVIRL